MTSQNDNTNCLTEAVPMPFLTSPQSTGDGRKDGADPRAKHIPRKKVADLRTECKDTIVYNFNKSLPPTPHSAEQSKQEIEVSSDVPQPPPCVCQAQLQTSYRSDVSVQGEPGAISKNETVEDETLEDETPQNPAPETAEERRTRLQNVLTQYYIDNPEVDARHQAAYFEARWQMKSYDTLPPLGGVPINAVKDEGKD